MKKNQPRVPAGSSRGGEFASGQAKDIFANLKVKTKILHSTQKGVQTHNIAPSVGKKVEKSFQKLYNRVIIRSTNPIIKKLNKS